MKPIPNELLNEALRLTTMESLVAAYCRMIANWRKWRREARNRATAVELERLGLL